MINAPETPLPRTDETPCFDALSEALFGADAALDSFSAPPASNPYDFFLSLIKIYDLHLGDLSPLDGQPRYAGHPSVARVKWDLENRWISSLSENVISHDADAFEVISSLAQTPLAAPYSNLDSGSDTLLLAAYFNAINRAFSSLSSQRPSLPFPALEALGLEVSDDAPELGYDLYPKELLALEAFAGLLATNHWLMPEALGALTLHVLLSPPRRAALFKAASTSGLTAPVPAPVFGDSASDRVLSSLSDTLTQHPEWSSRVATGALWYSQLDGALNARLTAQQ